MCTLVYSHTLKVVHLIMSEGREGGSLPACTHDVIRKMHTICTRLVICVLLEKLWNIYFRENMLALFPVPEKNSIKQHFRVLFPLFGIHASDVCLFRRGTF